MPISEFAIAGKPASALSHTTALAPANFSDKTHAPLLHVVLKVCSNETHHPQSPTVSGPCRPPNVFVFHCTRPANTSSSLDTHIIIREIPKTQNCSNSCRLPEAVTACLMPHFTMCPEIENYSSTKIDIAFRISTGYAPITSEVIKPAPTSLASKRTDPKSNRLRTAEPMRTAQLDSCNNSARKNS